MIAAQVARSTEQMVAKEISTSLVDSLDYILPCAYEKAPMGVSSIVHNVLERILSDLMRR